MSDRNGRGARLKGREGWRLARYRYRTPALAGPWRESREAALRDAIAAKQARLDESEPGGICWLVPGDIEEEVDGSVVRAHANGR